MISGNGYVTQYLQDIVNYDVSFQGLINQRLNNGTDMADTLPNIAANFPYGWSTTVFNSDATANLVITPPEGTLINGAASLTIAAGKSCVIYAGLDYYLTTTPN